MSKRIKTARLALAAALMAAGATGARASSMTFNLARLGDSSTCGRKCPEVISAVGEITQSTPRDFASFVAENIDDRRLHSIVFLHSPGGSVSASMQLGQMFRKVGMAAVVAQFAPTGSGSALVASGRCYSACAYALMGARKRVVPAHSYVGIHRMSFVEDEHDILTNSDTRRRVYAGQNYVDALAKYASSMGVSPQVIYSAEHVSPENLHIVTPAELRGWRLGTQKF